MSIWGEPFEDEFQDSLTHNQRGILSMANGGPNTNKVSGHTRSGQNHNLILVTIFPHICETSKSGYEIYNIWTYD